MKKYNFILRWYLILFAVAAHIAIGAGVVLYLFIGTERSIEYTKLAINKAKVIVKRQLKDPGKENLANRSITPRRDLFRFRTLPDARTDTLGYGRILRVGPGEKLDRPSKAAKTARDGDVIEIVSGSYPNDSIVWTKNDLLIRAVGGIAKLDAKGTRLAENKAIWVFRGNNIRVENIEFAHAQSKDKNGAGIRFEGDKLNVASCYFHDNESGILTSNNSRAQLSVENSEFAGNGHQNGKAHQIYVGTIDQFEITGSYIHGTHIGSAVKSRARTSSIKYNRIVDADYGRSNYTIDLSNGGEAFIVGNILQQSQLTENYTLVTYAPEGIKWEDNQLLLIHNTFVNDRKGGNFFRNHSEAEVQMINNLLIGEGSPITGPAVLIGNIVDHGKGLFGSFDETLDGLPGSRDNRFTDEVNLVDRTRFNYQLTSKSSAIDAALVLTKETMDTLGAFREYVHPLDTKKRQIHNTPDVGAYEYIPEKK